jgi:hypothetical protein
LGRIELAPSLAARILPAWREKAKLAGKIQISGVPGADFAFRLAQTP